MGIQGRKIKVRTAKLELRLPDLRRKTVELLEELQGDPKALGAFVKNPTSALANGIMKQGLSRQQVSEANRLLFALISNDEMLRWLKTYGDAAPGKRLDKSKFAIAFAKKVTELADPEIVSALVANAAIGNGIPGISPVAYQCVVSETTHKESTVCTPVAKDQLPAGSAVTPDALRGITEALLARAKELRNLGALRDLTRQVL